jgi:glycosyltransferase involved in cell wall biosynthesis
MPVLGPRFVSWSRLHHQKGHDRSIRIIAELACRGIDAHLDIWGADNGAGASLFALARTLGVAERVRFCGPVEPSRIPELAATNAFYMQLSRYEGMAMAVVEAMQLGLVPIVAPVGEMASYVQDAVNGIVVDPEDVRGAADRISELLLAPHPFSKMSQLALETWREAPLYRDDFCRSALSTFATAVGKRRRPQAVQ